MYDRRLEAISAAAELGSFSRAAAKLRVSTPALVKQVSGFEAGAVALVMLVYGVSVTVGNIWGGKLADQRGAVPALKIIFALLALVLLVLTFTAPHKWLMLATVLAWGAVAFGNVPGLQVYVVKQAERFSPRAVDVASGLNIAAFNVGIAFGAWAGGLIVERLGLVHTGWIGGLVVLGALALTAWAGRLDQRDGRDPAAVVSVGSPRIADH